MRKLSFLKISLLLLSIITSCNNPQQTGPNIVDTILTDQDSYFYLDTKSYPVQRNNIPIGVFDSGTGGLTVLEQILNFDEFNNGNHQSVSGGDGIRDFNSECFIYLGDQANMPYGNYSRENNVALLKEHIIKDAQFLLGNRYYLNAADSEYKTDKEPVKAIVIACNTATAYGKNDIEQFLERAGLSLKVIGVIDAGVKGALDIFETDENGSIAIMATAGTVSSQGYVKAIKSQQEIRGLTAEINIFQQAGIGLAGAIDGSIEHITATATTPRVEYKGPGVNHNDATIDTTILPRYGFDWTDKNILFDGNVDNPRNIQLNSVNNYIAYHLTSLLEKIRKSKHAHPLRTIILGCTHYPFYTTVFENKLNRLYNYQEDGQYIYRQLMAPKIELIDPARNTANQLYQYLRGEQLFNSADLSQSEFYISVPNKSNSNVQLDAAGNFTYDYKYGREAGDIQQYVKRVPFSKSTVPAETAERLKSGVPVTFGLIRGVN